ncbi:MAG: hypothetical protein DRO92_04715 [Candidatus Altiarchaeales archaeon]|nr:MAG: hypothetical protein DRO92_04715 [Candidatus Altiarchaeales archaeon]
MGFKAKVTEWIKGIPQGFKDFFFVILLMTVIFSPLTGLSIWLLGFGAWCMGVFLEKYFEKRRC